MVITLIVALVLLPMFLHFAFAIMNIENKTHKLVNLIAIILDVILPNSLSSNWLIKAIVRYQFAQLNAEQN